jgi:hypothetical protein
MIQRLTIIIILAIQVTSTQAQKVKLEIMSDSSATNGILTFHCQIINSTNTNYKYFGYVPDWKNNIYPQFWEITINNDTNSYMDLSWNYMMIHRVQSPDIKLKKHSTNKFDFTLNFNKLCKWSDLDNLVSQTRTQEDIKIVKQNYNNVEFGTYYVQIIYLKNLYDPQNPITLESNWVKIDYRK